MSLISFKIVLQILFICIVNVQSSSSTSREGRLLGAEWIDREQQDKNYKGSASMAVGYFKEFGGSEVGVIIAPDKLLLIGSSKNLEKARVSALKRGGPTNYDSVDGEEYPINSDESKYFEDFNLCTVKFGPLSSASKAVVATLPSSTPKAGNKDCIVYTYAPNQKDDTDPSHFHLGYLPLTIEENSVCVTVTGSSEYSDSSKYFCATVVSPRGSNPFCATTYNLDVFMLAFCQKSSTKEELVQEVPKEQNKELCIMLGHFWFGWCHHQGSGSTPVPAPEWVFTGAFHRLHQVNGCDTPNEKLYVIFAYIGNLDLS